MAGGVIGYAYGSTREVGFPRYLSTSSQSVSSRMVVVDAIFCAPPRLRPTRTDTCEGWKHQKFPEQQEEALQILCHIDGGAVAD
jgi:hypothetical protein